MVSQEQHKSLAIKWLKSTKLMSALFHQESKIIEAIARYNLQRKSSSSECLDTLDLIYKLVDQYELLLKGEVEPDSMSIPQQIDSQINSRNDSTIVKDPVTVLEVSIEQSSDITKKVYEFRDDGKPSEWDSWGLEQRLAYKIGEQSNQHIAQEKPSERPANKTADMAIHQHSKQSLGIESEVPNSSDKFNLHGMKHEANF
ncbi:hypothetical protein OCF84_20965 (plasmid) [Shewanella xiamenensis]|uniref:Uncharacterized protein n=1 Tax=Shewanella xiamenensis TaxID=332186 RepID=A0ABT6UFL1_9GAMM|nr:hypothetical protein [Shewanella xiamenensis]MDI5833258.1 hypothetical protein [Shewanella xiamenensis]WHF57991.1 hypothetical protein OCF84_20965 [Shewanella xiamenensis]